MKLIVFLKNKKKVVIQDGSRFLKEWSNGSKKILLSRKKNERIERHEIRDFIQARYYQFCKHLFAGHRRSY